MPRGGRRSTAWKPGQSGNPSGLPKDPAKIEAKKVIADVKAMAREAAPKAIETLTAIMEDKDKSAPARVAAAVAILDRGYGRPQQNVEVGPPGAFERLNDAELDAYIAREARAILGEFARETSPGNSTQAIEPPGRVN
jgi:Family of unknown function (DUF5681)